MPKEMAQISWTCPQCGEVRTMEMDPNPKREGKTISGADLEYEKSQVERALEKQAQRHLEFCKPRSNVLKGAQWSIPPGQRVKGPDED